jgi:hypothetical protein
MRIAKMSAQNILKVSVLAAMGLVVSTGAIAGSSAEQTVGYEVTAINEISVSDNVAAMTVSAAVAGSEPTPVTDATTTYAITTNEEDKKITAAINTPMPTGVTLSLTATAPTVGSSVGKVVLSDSAADVVTGITQVADGDGNTLTYELAATVAAGVVESASKTVTLTIVDTGT